ncbi:MAG: preprotein translocase subunit YajC [Corallococcus sp.]|nr:preprotein translocase subunit YajC [Corallococcus sp.]
MWFLLGFFEDASTGGNGEQTKPSLMDNLPMIIIMAVLFIGLIVYMVISSKKQKKAAAEREKQIQIGAKIVTIGGIVGEIIELDEQNFVLLTGSGENKTTMKFVRRAMYSLVNEETNTPNGDEKPEEVDEIK